MKIDIITIFPGIFEGFLSESLLARGQKRKIVGVGVHDLRKWTTDKHQTVDDRPYGGGPGMVLKIEPIWRAVQSLSPKSKSQDAKFRNRVILFSPRGKTFTQKDARRLAKYDQLILICGRYEGVDERVAKYIADEMISVGDYILNGGEVAAMVLVETVCRMMPGFIAKKESARKKDFPQYTRPEAFEIKSKINPPAGRQKSKFWKTPAVLLSGDHKKIKEWREKHR